MNHEAWDYEKNICTTSGDSNREKGVRSLEVRRYKVLKEMNGVRDEWC